MQSYLKLNHSTTAFWPFHVRGRDSKRQNRSTMAEDFPKRGHDTIFAVFLFLVS